MSNDATKAPILVIKLPLDAKGIKLGGRARVYGHMPDGKPAATEVVSYANAGKIVLSSMAAGVVPVGVRVQEDGKPMLIVNFFTPDQAKGMMREGEQVELLPVGTGVVNRYEFSAESNEGFHATVLAGASGVIASYTNDEDEPYIVLFNVEGKYGTCTVEQPMAEDSFTTA
jgi:hypothetical protein